MKQKERAAGWPPSLSSCLKLGLRPDVEARCRECRIALSVVVEELCGAVSGPTRPNGGCEREVLRPWPWVLRIEPRCASVDKGAGLRALERDARLSLGRRDSEGHGVAPVLGTVSVDVRHEDYGKTASAAASGSPATTALSAGEGGTGDQSDHESGDERPLEDGLCRVRENGSDPHVHDLLAATSATRLTGRIQSRGFASPAHAGFALKQRPVQATSLPGGGGA